MALFKRRMYQQPIVAHPSTELNNLFRDKGYTEKEVTLPDNQKITLILVDNFFVKMKTKTGKIVTTGVLNSDQINFIKPQLDFPPK
jgi:hypothetical protein